MPRPILLSGLSDIAADYDVLLCDVWGVIHNGREAFPAACAALARYRGERGPVVLISNAPRPSAALHDQIDGVGVPRAAWSAFVTSGDATRALLAERTPGPALVIGPSRDEPLYEGLGLRIVKDVEAAAFILCTGPYDEQNETPEDYRPLLAAAAPRGLEMICANPDLMVQKGDVLIYCAGAIAQLYETLGGRSITPGKPNAPIYTKAMREAERLLGHAPDPRRVLCVGDGAGTDVKGAQLRGLDCLFLWGGVHAADMNETATATSAELAAAFLETHKTSARYAMPELIW